MNETTEHWEIKNFEFNTNTPEYGVLVFRFVYDRQGENGPVLSNIGVKGEPMRSPAPSTIKEKFSSIYKSAFDRAKATW